MMEKSTVSSQGFLKALSPEVKDGVKYFPSKKTIFNTLIEARGMDVSTAHLPEISENPQMNAIHASAAGVNAVRARIKIATNSKDVTDSHFVDVALDAYIKSGGKFEDFTTDLALHKRMHEFEQQPAILRRSQASENRLYA